MTTPTSNADMAASFYGADPVPEAQSGPNLTPAQAKDQALAESLYAKPLKPVSLELPPAVVALRASEDNGVYDRTTGFDSVPFEAALAELDLPPEEVAANVQGYKNIAADVGASPAFTGQFLDIAKQLISNPPTDEQVDTMQADAKQAVREAYGDEADKLLALAKRMVARDPRLQRILNVTQAGSDKRVVLEAIELAKAQRAAGRLK